MRTALVLAAALLADGARAEGPGWAERLRRDAGGEPVLLVRHETQISGRNVSGSVKRDLARSPSDPLYDPTRELLWILDGDRLQVLDLRVPAPQPVVVVKGVPTVTDFQIEIGDESLDRHILCELPTKLTLKWSASPTAVASVDAGDRELPVVGAEWLKAQLGRPRRPAPSTHFFGESPRQRIKVPAKLCRVDDKSECGLTVPFGNAGWQLVRTENRDVGGDCPVTACVLYDPKEGRYASPPEAKVWGPLAGTKRGDCHLYRFDASAGRYLRGGVLCTIGGGCQELGPSTTGVAWLDPGPLVPTN